MEKHMVTVEIELDAENEADAHDQVNDLLNKQLKNAVISGFVIDGFGVK